MKKQMLLVSVFSGLVYLTLSSNSTGPAHTGNGDQTGRLGAAVTCAQNCHKDWGTGPFSTTTCKIELRRKDLGTGSAPVTGYIAGKTYIVTISGINSIELPKYGFQLTATIGNTAVGTFSNFPADVEQRIVSSIALVEHTAPLAGNFGSYATSFDWTAPATGGSAITFWGIINAVDGNSAYNNDRPSAGVSLVLQPATSVGGLTTANKFSIYPNPFTNTLTVKTENTIPGLYTINAFDLHGKKITEREVNVLSGVDVLTLSTEKWAPGYYTIQVMKGDYSETIPAVKR